MLKIMKKQLFVASVVAILTSAVTGLRADIIEQVLVKVNGDIISKTDLEQKQIAALRQKLQGNVDPQTLKDDAQIKQMLAQVTPQILVNAVDELLLIQYGKEQLGLKMSDEQFRQIVNNIRKEQGLQDEAKFQKALADENMTMDDLRKNLERSMLIEQVQRQEVGSKLNITEEEARQYYALHPGDFTEPAAIMLRELLVAVPTAKDGSFNASQDQAALAKINDARGRVLKAEDFAKVANEVSDSPSKKTGGLIGPFSPADMSPQLKALVEKMKEGDITPPIRTPAGYQIFKLESQKAAAVQPFDKVQDLIGQKIADGRTQTEMRKFLSRLRAQAIIEWKNPELKKEYDKEIAAETGTGGSE
jgi:peptidyl-prolyl cis-trans isomerase SurA